MNSARNDILAAILSAVPDRRMGRQAEYAAIQRDYPVLGTLDEAGRLDLLERRLLDYNATVYRCAGEKIADAIARALEARNKRSLVIPRGLTRKWLPQEFTFTPDEGLSYEELNSCEGVLTGCVSAIARTGTVVLRHSEVEGRRALTLIPDYHLCVVRADQVVETVVEGIRAIAQFRADPVTTISGPSATSDIEMTRIKGVHGPRVLDVILATS